MDLAKRTGPAEPLLTVHSQQGPHFPPHFRGSDLARPAPPANPPPLAAMKATSVSQRWAIIHDMKQGHSLKQIAERVGVSKKACRHWINRYQATGGVLDKQRTGRRQLLSAAAKQSALTMLLENQVGGARAVAKELLSNGSTARLVSKQTIIRAARSAGQEKGMQPLKALRGKPTKQLSAATMLKRLRFCKANQKTTWGSVMFTDRKKFAFNYPGSKVYPVTWVQGSGKRRANAVNHASVVNAYAGFTRFGMTKLHIVAGTTGHKTSHLNLKGSMARNITASEYKDVLEQTLLPEGRRMFNTQGISSWLLQQDNDPTHRKAPEIVHQYNLRHGSSIRVLPDWPPSSPDLSLIENVWSFLQSRLDSLGCRTFQEFKAALQREAKAINRVFSH